MGALPDCPILHVTHFKAGSYWVRRILTDLWPNDVVMATRQPNGGLYWPVQRAGVYPMLYLTKELFDGIGFPAEHRRFVIIRDLRDTLVSTYFSATYSHEINADWLAKWRQQQQSLAVEEALMHLIDGHDPSSAMFHNAQVQRSWLQMGERLFKFEELISDPQRMFLQIFVDHCGIDIDEDQLHEALQRNSFERLSGGRRTGVEDRHNHFRKGIAGDWKNHFSAEINDAFKRRYGELLIETGYEEDLNW